MPDLPTLIARAWWRARVGPFPLIGAEDMERAADHFIRILRDEHGIGFTDATGTPLPPPSNPVIWRAPVADANAERSIQPTQGKWGLVKHEGGAETVQFTTSLRDGFLLADAVLTSTGNVKTDLITLAVCLKVLRLDAAGMEVTPND